MISLNTTFTKLVDLCNRIIKHTVSYTAFKVWANDTTIPAGVQLSTLSADLKAELTSVYGDWVLDKTLESPIAAQKTEAFILRTILKTTDLPNCDIVIDWGDGTKSCIKNGDYDSAKALSSSSGSYDTIELDITVKHTYASAGVYTIKIYGKDYFGMIGSLCPNYTDSSLVDGVEADTHIYDYSLICNCLSKGLPIANHIQNLASAFRSWRLLKIDSAYVYPFVSINNVSRIFENNRNLFTIENLNITERCNFCNYMCRDCVSLEYSSIQLSSKETCNCTRMYYGCKNLANDIASLIPACSTIASNLAFTFYNCSSLTGTVPARYLWENGNINFEHTKTFLSCSAEIRAQVPISWSGTMKEVTPNFQIFKNMKVVKSPDTSITLGTGEWAVVYDTANITLPTASSTLINKVIKVTVMGSGIGTRLIGRIFNEEDPTNRITTLTIDVKQTLTFICQANGANYEWYLIEAINL